MKYSIQIIAGKYRGKKISFPEIDNIRPTPNRIKETLFNWLMHDIESARCLDAYAGSGSLGLEAFSRGASSVTFIEQNAIAFKHLNDFCKTFKANNLHVINTDIIKFITKNCSLKTSIFDIVFIDPPFSLPFPHDFIALLQETKMLKQNGLIYVEYKEPITLNPEHWEQLKLKQTGQVAYALYRKISL